MGNPSSAMKTFWTITLIILLEAIFIPGITHAQNIDRIVDNGTRQQQSATQQQPAAGQSSPSLNYNVLVPLPGVPQSINSDTNVSEYLVRIVQVILGFCVALATFMVLFGGVRMATTDAFTTRSEGKKTIQEALKGLAIALGAFLILNTISPNLVNFKLELPGVDIPAPPQTPVTPSTPTRPRVDTTTGGGGFNGKPIDTSFTLDCPTCVPLGSSGIATRNDNNVCNGTEPCKASASLVEKLQRFDQAIKATNPELSLYVSEGWPPTVRHASMEQRRGDSIDMNFNGVNPSGSSLQKVFETGKSADLTFIWEIPANNTSQLINARNAVVDELIAQGLDEKAAAKYASCRVIPVANINRAHFSTYQTSDVASKQNFVGCN